MALAAAIAAVVPGCVDGHDAADLAVGVAPFEQLRGMNMTSLRAGGVRAVRRFAEPAPFEGLREPVGAFDVLYSVLEYDGSDGSWPAEDALILTIEATREWPSDTAALAAWDGAVRAIKEGLAAEPRCVEVSGPGFTMRVAEWDRGDGWSLSATYAPSTTVGKDVTLSPRHRIAVRRTALTARYPVAGAPNGEARPTWSPVPCIPD